MGSSPLTSPNRGLHPKYPQNWAQNDTTALPLALATQILPTASRSHAGSEHTHVGTPKGFLPFISLGHPFAPPGGLRVPSLQNASLEEYPIPECLFLLFFFSSRMVLVLWFCTNNRTPNQENPSLCGYLQEINHWFMLGKHFAGHQLTSLFVGFFCLFVCLFLF